jgi:hypothetical protein
LEHLFFCECALGRVLGFFFLQSEVAGGFHASIVVIRAVLQCDLSSFVRACFFGKSGVGRGMLHA